ncbi:tryptophan synthase subunit alpha [bacterium]|nr:tryptophan synthase subunit alpha [bacterium]
MSDAIHTIPRGAAALEFAFNRRKEAGEKALVTYIMAGDPDLGTTEKIIQAFSGIDVDVIELGIPFSDPMADGPVIQEAAQRSLRQHVSVEKTLKLVEEIRLHIDTPIVFMTYFNLFYRFGLEKFAQRAAQAGVDGVIIPDLPLEEADEFNQILDKHGLAYIYLIAPTSTSERIQKISDKARGFIYYVSRTGVTGEQKSIADDLAENVQRIQSLANIPVAVGFGVSSPEQAVAIAEHADGVVIGSAIVRIIAEAKALHERETAKFIKPYIDALHKKTASNPK